MYKLKNNKKFLVTINLKSKSIHLMPLETFNVADDDFTSLDLQAKIRSKFISIVLRQINDGGIKE